MLPNFNFGNWCRDPGLVDSCISSYWVKAHLLLKLVIGIFLMQKNVNNK